MKVALCQIDTTVGDFDGNRQRIVERAHEARRAGAQLAVFPELAVCGYAPEDLLLHPAFLEAHDRALTDLAVELPPDLCVLVGCVERNSGDVGRSLFNAVARVEDGLAQVVARKSLLPTYDVFDESRYFAPWPDPKRNRITVGGRRIGVVVCEDGWNDEYFFEKRHYDLDPVAELAGTGVDFVVNLSASPWAAGKERLRLEMVRASAERHGLPICYVNLVGGNVASQFDGGSFAVRPGGFAAQPRWFEEGLTVVDTDAGWNLQPIHPPRIEMQHAALVQGIRAYCRKFGFERVLVGLSGGIDSALTAALAAAALGPRAVVGIALPGPHSSAHSREDAAALARNLGIEFHELPIAPAIDGLGVTLEPVFAGTEPDIAEENLQARARGTLLMAYANKFDALLLTTGNKSESAVGYCTLYGDMNGGLAVIADLWKTEVWEMARWINRDGERIPQRTIDKPPSAELRPDQLDTDSLPPYDRLDPVLRLLVEERVGVADAAAATGMPVEEVARLHRFVMVNEFKRFQYAPTLRITDASWAGRRVPVAHRFVDRGAEPRAGDRL